MSPHFEHDCKMCVYLGDYVSKGVIYDLYVCSYKDMIIDTLIARYSSDGPDYCSGIYFTRTIPMIEEAYERARALSYRLPEYRKDKGG